MPAPDLPDLVREADRALAGITPGEWRWTNEVRQRLVTGDDDNLDREIIRCAALLHPQRPDAEFIAAAPDLVRRLRDAYVEEFIAEDRAQQRLERAQADKAALVQALNGKVATLIDRERDALRAERDEAQHWAELIGQAVVGILGIHEDEVPDQVELLRLAQVEAEFSRPRDPQAHSVKLGDTVEVYDGRQRVARLRIVDAGPQMDAKMRVHVGIEEATPPHRPVGVSVDGQILVTPPAEWLADALTKTVEQGGIDAARADRLAATVRKLAGWAGHDIADLIDEGYLQDGDLG